MRLSFLIILLSTLSLHLNGLESNSKNTRSSDKILGVWVTENKDLKVQVYIENDSFSAKIIGFTCTCDEKSSMASHKDTKNPDPKCRENSWLNSKLLWGLKYDKEDYWYDGSVYDISTGSTYSATATLINDEEIKIRGYWGFEVFGKSILFFREKS